MRIIIAGKNNIAIDIAEYVIEKFPEYNLFSIFNKNDVGIDGFQRSYKKYCDNNGIKSISIDTAYGMDKSIFLSLEFDRIVDPAKFKHQRIYNIHFSLLPKYKGMYTSAWPILNNEEKTGVTFHKIDKGIDTGAIIFQKPICIDKNETAKTLYSKYIKEGTAIVLDNIESIFNNKYQPNTQNKFASSYYSKQSIDYCNLKVDVNKTAIEIKKQIDAYTFRDYQLPKILGEKVFGCELLNTKSKEKPGTLVKDDGKCGFIISTIDYDLRVFRDIFFEFLDACTSGELDFIERMKNDYLINEKTEEGWSPIIVAAYHGKVEVIKILLSCGGDINDTNYNGTTVFMYAKDYAIKNNDKKILRELVKLGADVSLKDINLLTVFDYVEQTEDKIAIDFMREFR